MSKVEQEMREILAKKGCVYESDKITPHTSCVYYVVRQDMEGLESVVYVGQGIHNRWKHALSGKSHSQSLNDLVASGIPMETRILQEGLMSFFAANMETALLRALKPCCNIKGVNRGGKVSVNRSRLAYLEEIEQLYLKMKTETLTNQAEGFTEAPTEESEEALV